MKRIVFFIFAVVALVSVQNVTAQSLNVDMEDVTKTGGNCDYDDENCIASFTGKSDRWIDIPGIKGDISATPNMKLEILKSNVVLKVAIRYKGSDGKTLQVIAATFYRQMGKVIESSKTIKINLIKDSKGKVTEEMLKNVVSIRISMAKECSGAEEPLYAQFGSVSFE